VKRDAVYRLWMHGPAEHVRSRREGTHTAHVRDHRDRDTTPIFEREVPVVAIMENQ
jgi:hypothetical protein